MTDNQNNIIGKILMDMSASVIPATEAMIAMMVDMYDTSNAMTLGTARLTPEERDQVIAELHASLCVKIDRGHFVKERDQS